MRKVVVVVLGFAFSLAYARPQTQVDSLLSKIEEAREKVKGESVRMIYGVVGTRKVRIGRRRYAFIPINGVVGRQMAIAVLDGEGAIHVVRAVKRDSGLEVLTPGYMLSLRRENGINSDIACIVPAGGKVLAVKYPVSNEGNRFGPGPQVIEAVYTPYSAEIKTEELIRQGLKVQAEFIGKAYEQLERRRVFSRAFPGKLVTDVIPRKVLTVLLINEHIDPGEFRSAAQAQPLVERVLTIIGANRDKAYAYSISKAGARGLVQMIPSTYARILSLYPSAGLASSFTAGMADPVNAIMAQVLLCDCDWQAIRARSNVDAARIGPYLAAAYNGGVSRVLSIFSHGEEDWMDEPDLSRRPKRTVTRSVAVRVRTRRGRVQTRYVLRSYVQPIFRSETSKYIQQYHWINNYLVTLSLRGFTHMRF
jgi:hypothetical protein